MVEDRLESDQAPGSDKQGSAQAVRLREVPAVRRAVAILQHLAHHPDGQGVSRIARELDIIPSTCLHILRELASAHLVKFDPHGKLYRLGFGVLSLARQLSSHDPTIQVVTRQLNGFSHKYGTSISGQMREGEDIVIVATAVGNEGLEAPLGRRLPCLSAAGGRLFAGSSGWSQERLLHNFTKVKWQDPPPFNVWLGEVELAKRQGYAIDEGRFRLGITSIAAAIRGRDESVILAISVNLVSVQLEAQHRSDLIQALRMTAKEVEASLL